MVATGNDLNISQSGYVAFDGVATFSGRTFQAGAGVTITNPDGTTGNTTISLVGAANAVQKINVDTITASGTNPVLSDGSGAITISGGQYATGTFGTRVVDINSPAPNTLNVLLQISGSNASSLSTKNGICHFNSNQHSVDANGFVSIINGGFTWTDVTTATQTLATQNGYLTDRGGGVTYTLPATANIGDEIRIVGKAGLATITPNANQRILMGSASGTVGVTGTAVATNAGDCIDLICTTSGASTVWRAANWVGNWTLT